MRITEMKGEIHDGNDKKLRLESLMDFSENGSDNHCDLFLFRDIFGEEGDEASLSMGQFS